MSETPTTTMDAATLIARKSPEAAGILAACMEANAREAAWVDEQIRGGLERERDYWKQRARDAELHLAAISDRFARLLDPPALGELDGPA